jgi:GTPase SAR1 family protein
VTADTGRTDDRRVSGAVSEASPVFIPAVPVAPARVPEHEAVAADSAETDARPPEAGEPSEAPDQPVEKEPLTAREQAAQQLLSAVERLRVQVATLSLTLDLEGAAEARRERDGVLSQLDDYLLPRLRRRDAPLLAVIGGSTGAGKSTLTNSLVRREVSRSGVLRPTTRSPVLVHHPQDSGAFMSQRILPRLTRVTSEAPEPLQPIDPNAPRITGLRLVPHDGLAPGMAIIDAPDIDSLVETNRDLAVQLLQAADLWIFVTTAARYADAMPWKLLQQAAERGAAVAVVLDRVPPESLQELRIHLATRLRERGLGGAPLFVIPETRPVDGFLPESIVAPLQKWLRRVAGDPASRSVIAERTLKGAVASLPGRTDLLALAAEAQAVGWTQLRCEVEDVFIETGAQLASSLTDGSLISGEVLARWQEFMADGEFVRRLDGGPPSLADRVSSVVRREEETVTPFDVPVTEGVTDVVRGAIRTATDEVLDRWRRRSFGTALLTVRGHQATATDVGMRLERAVRDWRLEVSARIAALVESTTTEDAEARVDAQTASDVLFMVLVDERSSASSSDSSDSADSSDDAPAAGTVGAARRIIERFLGAEPVRTLVAEARADLRSCASVVLDGERRRLERLLESNESVAGRGDALRTAVELVKQVG